MRKRRGSARHVRPVDVSVDVPDHPRRLHPDEHVPGEAVALLRPVLVARDREVRERDERLDADPRGEEDRERPCRGRRSRRIASRRGGGVAGRRSMRWNARTATPNAPPSARTRENVSGRKPPITNPRTAPAMTTVRARPALADGGEHAPRPVRLEEDGRADDHQPREDPDLEQPRVDEVEREREREGREASSSG